ncbi:hypothetical protein [Stomatohabitans albus]|uniref:YczE/YyaS/YitT family protein n=1 Tax=Stomatohabitans albus TaxID=3110766 RepID=UPI00300CDCC1
MAAPHTTRSWLTYLVGIFFLGIGIGFQIKANLGVSSWQAFELGVVKFLHLEVEKHYHWLVLIYSLIIIAIAWIALNSKPGWGTFPIAFGLGFIAQIPIYLMRSIELSYMGQWIVMIIGGFFAILGIGLYISGDHGPSPQDCLYVGILRKFRIRPSVAKVAIDLFAIGTGWALSGFAIGTEDSVVSWGTVLITVMTLLTLDYTIKLGSWLADHDPTKAEPDPSTNDLSTHDVTTSPID